MLKSISPQINCRLLSRAVVFIGMYHFFPEIVPRLDPVQGKCLKNEPLLYMHFFNKSNFNYLTPRAHLSTTITMDVGEHTVEKRQVSTPIFR